MKGLIQGFVKSQLTNPAEAFDDNFRDGGGKIPGGFKAGGVGGLGEGGG
jgi:hypothetical protein